MKNSLITYSVYFLALIIIQILVLNNMQISSYLNPYCYVLLILILPLETPGWLLLSVAFVLGLIIDSFPQGWSGAGASLGFHAFATVLMAFSRPYILKWINPRDEYDAGTKPGAKDLGFGWYIRYSSLMIGIHHLSLFLFESLSFARLPETLLRIALSGMFTLLLIIVWEGLRYRRN